MISWVDFVASISEDELKSVISDYERLATDGVIGECTLRSLARRWTNNIGVNAGVTIWMDRVAFEAYKHFARRYLNLE